MLDSFKVPYVIPSDYLAYFYNGDATGLTDEEEKTLAEFEQEALQQARRLVEYTPHKFVSAHWDDNEPLGFVYDNELPGELGRQGAICHEINLAVMTEPR